MKLSGYYFWNGLIRLAMETFLEIVLTVPINLALANWDSPFKSVRYSNNLAVTFLVLMSVLVPILIVLYCCNFSMLKEDRF